MEFGIYVHTQGPGGLLKEVARVLDSAMKSSIQCVGFDVIDGIYISFRSSCSIQSGYRVCKNRVRRDCRVKLITGGSVHYNCLIECDIDLPDADVIEANSTDHMYTYLKSILGQVTPKMFKSFSGNESEQFLLAIDRAVLR